MILLNRQGSNGQVTVRLQPNHYFEACVAAAGKGAAAPVGRGLEGEGGDRPGSQWPSVPVDPDFCLQGSPGECKHQICDPLSAPSGVPGTKHGASGEGVIAVEDGARKQGPFKGLDPTQAEELRAALDRGLPVPSAGDWWAAAAGPRVDDAFGGGEPGTGTATATATAGARSRAREDLQRAHVARILLAEFVQHQV